MVPVVLCLAPNSIGLACARPRQCLRINRTLLTPGAVFVAAVAVSIGAEPPARRYGSSSPSRLDDAARISSIFAIIARRPRPGRCSGADRLEAGLGGCGDGDGGTLLPSSFVVMGAAVGRWPRPVWHSAVERGLAPIAAGLILSGGIARCGVSPGGPAIWIAAALATVCCCVGRAPSATPFAAAVRCRLAGNRRVVKS